MPAWFDGRLRITITPMAIPTFNDDHIEQIARTLADARTHAQYTELFQRLGFEAPDANSGAKWLRIREALKASPFKVFCG